MASSPATPRRISGLIALLSLTACRPAALPSTEAPSPTAGSSAVSARGATIRPLTVWTVSALEAVDEHAPSLRRTIAEQVGSLPETPAEIAVVTKPAYGAAGIAAFLRSTARVAPDRLPDLCVLPLELVAELEDEGLIRPIDDPLLAERTADAFPFAGRLVGDGQAMTAIPIAVDLLHAIGRDAPVPERWQDLASGAPMVMPLGGAATPRNWRRSWPCTPPPVATCPPCLPRTPSPRGASSACCRTVWPAPGSAFPRKADLRDRPGTALPLRSLRQPWSTAGRSSTTSPTFLG